MSSPRTSSDNIPQYAARRPSRPSLDIPYTPNYSRPLFAQSSVSFPSPEYGGQQQQRMQRRMHSIDAFSTFSGMRAAAAQHQHLVFGEEAANISSLLDSFPAVPTTMPPPYDTFPRTRGRSVSLSGNALRAAHGVAEHKKSFSDPMPTTQPKLSPKKSFKQSLRSLFHRETRKSNTDSPSTSSPASMAPMTPPDETARLRAWTLNRSPRKLKKPQPRPSFDVEPPSPADSGALADHEHLSPITWGAGKTVNVFADGLTRKASVLLLDTDTLVLRMHPSPSLLSLRRQPAFQMIDGKPACRHCGELFYLAHSPSCACGADSDEENDYGEVIDRTSEDNGDCSANPDSLPAYAH